jgi:hypothetical protein
MAKPKLKTTLQQPDKAELAQEEQRREGAEHSARAGVDGRFLRRKPPRYQIGVKTNEAVKKEFDRIRELSGKSYTDLFDEAITDLGKKYDALNAANKSRK